MLTTAAFNAFLKTLEEPPAHVIFVLATTDPQKIPITVLSRCQRFDLKRIGNDDIISRLQYICNQEKIKLDESSIDVLEYIASSVDGGMRDAIKLLQKCTSLDEVITVQTVIDALGSVNVQHVTKLITLLLELNIKDSIIFFNNLVRDGVDIRVLIATMIEDLKNMMTNSLSNGNNKIKNELNLAESLIRLLADLKYSSLIKTSCEIAFIKICSVKLETSGTELSTVYAEPGLCTTPPATQEFSPEYLQAVKQLQETVSKTELRVMALEMANDTRRFGR